MRAWRRAGLIFFCFCLLSDTLSANRVCVQCTHPLPFLSDHCLVAGSRHYLFIGQVCYFVLKRTCLYSQYHLVDIVQSANRAHHRVQRTWIDHSAYFYHSCAVEISDVWHVDINSSLVIKISAYLSTPSMASWYHHNHEELEGQQRLLLQLTSWDNTQKRQMSPIRSVKKAISDKLQIMCDFIPHNAPTSST